MSTDYPGVPDGSADEDDIAEPSPRFLTAMQMAETPEQQAIAREIYKRLEEGAEVEDIKPLIEQQMRIVVTQRNGGRVDLTEESAGPSGVVGGGGGGRDPWGAGPGSGLGGRTEEDPHGW